VFWKKAWMQQENTCVSSAFDGVSCLRDIWKGTMHTSVLAALFFFYLSEHFFFIPLGEKSYSIFLSSRSFARKKKKAKKQVKFKTRVYL
jgi:hypothetical protein